MKSAKFKDSPLGPIPEDWEVKRLGKICDVQLGKMLDSAKNQGEECFYLTNKDVQWGRISVSDLRRMRMSEDDRQRFSLRQGDLLVCEGGEVGRCAIWNSEVEGCCFQKTIHRVRANVSDTIDMRFLQPLLCVYAKKGVFDPYISCTSIAHLTKEKFELLEIICPPLPEQQRIAEALGEVDKLIESLDEQVEKKRLIAKGVAHDLLSGKKRLPGFKEKWKSVALDEIGVISKGSGISRAESNTGCIPAVRYGEIYTHHDKVVLNYVSRISDAVAQRARPLKKGDVLFAASGETVEEIGKAVAIKDDGVFAGGDTIVFSPYEELPPTFLGHLLNSPYVQEQKSVVGHGATIVHIKPKDIGRLRVSLPAKAEQQAIADLLSEQDATIAALEAKREKYARIKEGMMRDLLTGKKRMKGE